MKAVTAYFREPRTPCHITGVYVVCLSYFLLMPEPLFFLGTSGEEFHQAVDSRFSAYWQHTTTFAILTALVIWTARVSGRLSLAALLLPTCGYALLTEFLQLFIPRRSGDPLDVLADFAGIFLALALWAAGWLLKPSPFEPGLPPEALPSDR
jgi:VanZ family protein